MLFGLSAAGKPHPYDQDRHAQRYTCICNVKNWKGAHRNEISHLPHKQSICEVAKRTAELKPHGESQRPLLPGYLWKIVQNGKGDKNGQHGENDAEILKHAKRSTGIVPVDDPSVGREPIPG